MAEPAFHDDHGPAAWNLFARGVDRLTGRLVPVRLVLFVTVGMAGATGHFTVLGVMTQALHLPFAAGQAAATAIAMTINFFLNNILTYRDRRLRGRGLARGLASFYIACGLGAVINVIVATVAFDSGVVWWLAGLLGATIGVVWNFTITALFTWKRTASSAPADAGRDIVR